MPVQSAPHRGALRDGPRPDRKRRGTVREAFRAHHLLPSNLSLVKTVRHTGWVTGIAGISECEIAACALDDSKVFVINMNTGTSTVLVDRLETPRDVDAVSSQWLPPTLCM